MKRVAGGLALHEDARLVMLTSGTASHFFGYYDPTPFDSAEQRVLCHRVAFDGRMVRAGDRAEVGYCNLGDGAFTAVAETGAFNWQQGAMLRWLPGSQNDSLIFNDRCDDRYAARIVCIADGSQRRLPTTVYAITSDGKIALTPRFERLEFCRPGYCYFGVADRRWDVPVPAEDGIVGLDLATGETRLLVTTLELAERAGALAAGSSAHYVEHIMVSPSGSGFIFFHRWMERGGGIYTRLYSADLDGSGLFMYPDSGRYSHANWSSANTFVVWGRPVNTYARVRRSPGLVRRVLAPALWVWRRFYDNRALARLAAGISQDSYLLFKLDDSRSESVGRGVLTCDGHPSFHPGNPSWMLTDTYQDANGLRKLLLFHVKTGQCITLATISSNPDWDSTGFRCDLHPRFSPSGRLVSLDVPGRVHRQNAVVDISALVSQVQ